VILGRILRDKKAEVRRVKSRRPLETLIREASRLPRRKNLFLTALRSKKGMAVIAEIKRRSPSRGLLRRDFDPVGIAREYQRAGAAALSVLTDKKYFGGSARILRDVRKATRLPILRKDFMVDAYQIYESRLLGADAILLIARALSRAALKRFHALAGKLGLETLFEVHTLAELKKVLPLKPRLLGVNNRDLGTFDVDLDVTRRLARRVPRSVLLVSESGITGPEDISALKKYGVRAVLVGETLMKDKNPKEALKRLLGKIRG
jgi:indole-3-glycerol phosphate synthase